MKPVCKFAGDTGLIVEFGQGIDPDVNAGVRAMAGIFRKQMPDGVVEIIPSYRSLLFVYDPARIRPNTLIRLIENSETAIDTRDIPDGAVVEIPVCYGGKYGPDIETVCKSAGLDIAEVIHRHSRPEYLIYMVGFTPGFPFLGGLDERLSTPRLATPRIKVPRGSVGIANNQTGIYPVESPGGWQIIGKTPLQLFDPLRKNPLLYKAGDRIKFVPISEAEFKTIQQKDVT